MQDELASSWLTSAESAWSGHYAALTDRLTRPEGVRLTEEQAALALGIAQRLVLELAAQLPLGMDGAEIWARWESEGLPSGHRLVPPLLARVEEHRWRRQAAILAAEPPVPLFQHGGLAPDAVIDIPQEAADPNAIDAAYLALRIADGARVSAMGQPLLLAAEVPLAVERALLLDLAAEDMAAAGHDNVRAADLAKAIDAISAARCASPIESAAQSYHAAATELGLLGDVARVALGRRDWLAVIALLAAELRTGFSQMSSMLLTSDDDRLRVALAMIGVEAADAGPLLDALADVPGRPVPNVQRGSIGIEAATMAAVTARAANLRGRGV